MFYEFDHVNSVEPSPRTRAWRASRQAPTRTTWAFIRLTIDPATRQVARGLDLIPCRRGRPVRCGPRHSDDVDKAEVDFEGSRQARRRHPVHGALSGAASSPLPRGPRILDRTVGIESLPGDLVADLLRETTTPTERALTRHDQRGGLRADLSRTRTMIYAQTGNEPSNAGIRHASRIDVKDALEQQWKTDLNPQNSRPRLARPVLECATPTIRRSHGELRITSVRSTASPQ